MTFAEYLLAAAISLCCGAVAQATLGFGMGVVSIPLMVWSGMSLPEAIGALAPNVVLQTTFGCWQNRRALPWSDVAMPCLWRYLSLPLGVQALAIIAEQGQAVSRGILGIGLLLLLVIQARRPHLAERPRSTGETARPRSGQRGMALAGLSSGFLAGVIGMGGPPLVLWVMQQNWSPQRQRSFLWLSFLLVIPWQIAAMFYRFRWPWLNSLAVGACISPLVLLVVWQAGRWSEAWSKRRLQTGMRWFLVLIALKMIVEFGYGVLNA